MSERISNMARGQTETGLAHLAGVEKVFKDVDPDDPMTLRSQRSVKARRVLNDSGVTLNACEVVKYKAAGWGTTIGAVCAAGDKPAGVVDEFIGANGVPDGSYFWMVYEGPTELINSDTDTVSEGEVLVTDDDGEVKPQTAAPADQTAVMVQVNSRVGFAMAAEAVGTGSIKFLADVRLA